MENNPFISAVNQTFNSESWSMVKKVVENCDFGCANFNSNSSDSVKEHAGEHNVGDVDSYGQDFSGYYISGHSFIINDLVYLVCIRMWGK